MANYTTVPAEAKIYVPRGPEDWTHRTCSKCGETKPRSQYHHTRKKREGRVVAYSCCKDCWKKVLSRNYQVNKEKYKEYAQEYYSDPDNVERRRTWQRQNYNSDPSRMAARTFVAQYLKEHPCRCGHKEIVSLEFHHKKNGSDKEFTISDMMAGGKCDFDALAEEVGKCEVLCANCHQIETIIERGHWKSKPKSEWKAAQIYVMNYLSEHPCESCGESNPMVLQFDHINPAEKEIKVTDLCRRRNQGKKTVKRLREEIEKCRVLCANCHRERTAIQQGWWYLDYR